MDNEEHRDDLRIPMPVLDRENANVEAKWEAFYYSRSAEAWQAYAVAHRRACMVAQNLYPDFEVLKPIIRIKASNVSQTRVA